MCVSLVSFHFRHKMLSIFYLVCVCVCEHCSSFRSLLLPSCIHIFRSAYTSITLPLVYITIHCIACVAFFSCCVVIVVAIHFVVCTWTCNDKFYWKVSLTRIFISSSQQHTAPQHNENRMRWSEFLCNRHLKKNHPNTTTESVAHQPTQSTHFFSFTYFVVHGIRLQQNKSEKKQKIAKQKSLREKEIVKQVEVQNNNKKKPVSKLK